MMRADLSSTSLIWLEETGEVLPLIMGDALLESALFERCLNI